MGYQQQAYNIFLKQSVSLLMWLRRPLDNEKS